MSSHDDEEARRLLVVSDTLIGGTGEAVVRHAGWFASRGWTVSVAAPADEETARRVEAHEPVAMPSSARQLGGLRRSAGELRTVLHRLRPDVVHCHGARSFVVTRLAGCRAPFVTLHGIRPVSSDPPGYALARRAGLSLVPPLAAGAFAVFPGPPPGWRFLPHASPRLGSVGVTGTPSTEHPTFLWVGALQEPKRPSTFVSALALLARSHPEVRGVMAGTGPEAAALEAQIVRSRAPVELVGHVEDVGALLERAWAVVLFSDAEGVPFALEEAMWAGRPAVASPLPGIRWLVGTDDGAGALATTAEEAALAMAALCLPGEAARRGRAAAARVRRLLSADDPWPAVETAYGVRRAPAHRRSWPRPTPPRGGGHSPPS